jgi:ankyrin repeat protein
MWAAEKGDIEIVRMLIEAGADVNAFDEIHPGTNALLEAVKRGGSYEMVELLVNAGANPTITGCMGSTALDEARWRVKFSTPSKEEALKLFALLEEAAKKYTIR